jgi:hypothetical protein
VQQRVGWRAERAGPVDGGRAADAAPLQDVDGLVGRLARGTFLVERRIGLAFDLVEIAARTQRAFFDDDDVESGLRQQFGRDAGTGTAADDDDIAPQLRRQRRMRPAMDTPAASQAFADRVGDRCHAGPVVQSAAGPG